MNPLNINHIKVEKSNDIKPRYKNLRKTTNYFQIFKFLIILVVISRVSLQLPLALFKFSIQLTHQFIIFLINPPFVFILGNAVVITLFMNSKTKTLKSSSKMRKNSQLQRRFARNREKEEENTMLAMIISKPEHQVIKIYHRSQSEKIKREKLEKKCWGLRRSKTEFMRLKDDMSNDEFRKIVEDFIAKQQKFLREEEYIYGSELEEQI